MDTANPDHSTMQLGKAAPSCDPRTLQMAAYLNVARLPPAPLVYSYSKNIGPSEWGMMANDKINNCTCVSAGHLIMEWTSNNGKMVRPGDQDIISAYSALTGYDPATGKNNLPAAATQVLNYWRQHGIASHKILAYAALELKNHDHVKQSIYLFGGLYIGLALPLSAKTQQVWSLPDCGASGDGAPGSWGGHAVAVIGYDAQGLTAVSWGAIKQMTWEFWDAYCDESFAVISTDFLTNNIAPNGLHLAALQQDLNQITS